MDSVKRRLVYVADDNDELVRQLTGGGTPPTRASRFSRLQVSASGSSQSSSKGPMSPGVDSPVPKPAADPLLIISYDGNLIADGSGSLHFPRNYGEARAARHELRKCFTFLTEYMHHVSGSTPSPSTSTAGLRESTSSSSASYSESSDEYSDDEDEEEDKPRRRNGGVNRYRRQNTTSKSGAPVDDGASPAMTVAELRDALRERGLPVAGVKAALEERLRLFINDERGSNTNDSRLSRGAQPDSVGVHGEQFRLQSPRERVSGTGSGSKRPRESTHSAHFASPVNEARSSTRSSSQSAQSHERGSGHDGGQTTGPSHLGSPSDSGRRTAPQRFSHLVSPSVQETSLTESTRRSRGLWGALVTVGSRLFGQSAASQSPYYRSDHNDPFLEPDLKRRRSA